MRKTLAVLMVIALLVGFSAAAAQEEPPAPSDEGDPALAAIASQTYPFMGGGVFVMGTSQAEVQAGLAACAPDDACDESSAQDALTEHQVPVAAYQIELYEVSNAQYAAFLNTLGPDGHLDGCLGAQCILTRDDDPASNIVFDGEGYAPADGAESLPVTHVSWFGAQAYCEAVGRRLPSEAEWELAARGPNRAAYPWGDAFDPALANTARTEGGGLAAVDAYPEGASAYGALNMAGNVAEWVYDWYASDFYATEAATQLNPTGPETGAARVVRGGSWQDPPFYVRSAHRASLEPDAMLATVGFRCVVDGWPAPAAPRPEIMTDFEGIESGAMEDGSPYLGSPDAPVVLTEFFQFTCPHCNEFRATLHQLLPYVRDGKVMFVARVLPASSQLSIPPIFFSLCAVEQGAYWLLQDYFFDGYFQVDGPVAYLPDRLRARAETLGLDMEAFDACLADDTRLTAIQDTVTASSALASEKGVSGVPTVLLNGEYITSPDGQPMTGALTFDMLQGAIDKALSAGETSGD